MKGFAQRAIQWKRRCGKIYYLTRRCGHLHSPPGILQGGGDEREEGSEIFTEDQIKAFEAALSPNNSRAGDFLKSNIEMDLARREKRRTLLNSLAQQGITFNQLKGAYDEAFHRGQSDMVYFRLTFFYAATAIAIREAFNTSADSTAAFLKTMLEITGQKAEDRSGLLEACKAETVVDVSGITTISGSLSHSRVVQTGPGSRKDRAAVQRMREKGISPEDLEYERDTGYANGWATEFHAASCYAALALALHDVNKSNGEEIEEIIDRVGAIQDEEITVEDIVKRCGDETGVDVSQMARTTTNEL